jgi:hypothetical protein
MRWPSWGCCDLSRPRMSEAGSGEARTRDTRGQRTGRGPPTHGDDHVRDLADYFQIQSGDHWGRHNDFVTPRVG